MPPKRKAPPPACAPAPVREWPERAAGGVGCAARGGGGAGGGGGGGFRRTPSGGGGGRGACVGGGGGWRGRRRHVPAPGAQLEVCVGEARPGGARGGRSGLLNEQMRSPGGAAASERQGERARGAAGIGAAGALRAPLRGGGRAVSASREHGAVQSQSEGGGPPQRFRRRSGRAETPGGAEDAHGEGLGGEGADGHASRPPPRHRCEELPGRGG